jgi:peptidoglycan/LPS O-acetylase OafA/YrhL
VNRNQRIPELDGLRGLAILLIIVWHYIQNSIPLDNMSNARIIRLLSWTWSGVDLFFVLSGFLIGGILLDNVNSPQFYKTFYIRRFFRIVPIYAVWLLLYYIVFSNLDLRPYLGVSGAYWLIQPVSPLLPFVTFTQNYYAASAQTFGNHWLDATWSLAVEEQFYLILPFIIKNIPQRALPAIFSFAIVIALLARNILANVYGESATIFIYVSLITRADSLFAGALIAYAMRRPAWLAHLQNGKLATVMCGLGALGIGYLLLLNQAYLGSASQIAWAFSAFVLFYSGILILLLTQKYKSLLRFFNFQLLRYLGLIAYGVYLFHQAIHGFAHGLILKQQPLFYQLGDIFPTIVAVMVVLVLARFSWLYIEKPLVNYSHRFTYGKKR